MLSNTLKAPAPAGIFTQVVDQTIQNAPSFEERHDLQSMWVRESGHIRLQGRFFDSPMGELRSVHISGPKIQIINAFFFPHSHINLPIYAMEMVIYGKKPVVAVIDLLGMPSAITSQERAKKILKESHSSNPLIEQGEDPPQWFKECRSGNDFFVRPKSLSDIPDLIEINLHLWKQFVKLYKQQPLSYIQDPKAHQKEISAYKDHHRENSPGLTFLNRSFGSKWTTSFLKYHLFV